MRAAWKPKQRIGHDGRGDGFEALLDRPEASRQRMRQGAPVRHPVLRDLEELAAHQYTAANRQSRQRTTVQLAPATQVAKRSECALKERPERRTQRGSQANP